ncbi:MAG: hypothetical protein ACI88Z_001373, partial [Sphingobacteriales bacterium]
NVSQSTYNIIKDDFNFIPRGKIQTKNTGLLDMCFVG